MINRQNYSFQKSFLKYVQNVKNRTPETVKRAKTYTNHFLIWLDDTPIPKAHEKEGSFPQFLVANRQKNSNNEDSAYQGLHPNTQKKTIQTTKRFLNFLKLAEPEKMQSLPLLWIESLTPVPTIELPSEHIFVTFDEIREIALYEVPEDDIRLLRAQASGSFLFLSGGRNEAFTSTPIKAIDLENLEFHQWPKYGVRTKNRKHATTYLLNISELLIPVKRWDRFVKENLSLDAMWFAPLDSNTFGKKNSLSARKPGRYRAKSLNNDLKLIYKTVDLEYKSAHKHRHGHAIHALLNAKTMAQFKAISQNLMHEDMKVTDSVYAWLNDKEIYNQLMSLDFNAASQQNFDPDLQTYLEGLSKDGLQEAIKSAAMLLANS